MLTPLQNGAMALLNKIYVFRIASTSKISGLKSVHTHSIKQFTGWSCNKSTVSAVHFDINPFTCSREEAGGGGGGGGKRGERGGRGGGKKSLNDFKFGTVIGRFPGEGAASVAMKGLIK